jgi:hypothetical protein
VNIGDMLITRALAFEENKPIAVRAVHQAIPGRGMP